MMNFILNIAKATEDVVLPKIAETGRAPNSYSFATIYNYIVNIIQILLEYAGIICLIMLFYAALMYALSYGDDAKIETAKKTITWALVGLLIVALAATIVTIIQKQIALPSTPVVTPATPTTPAI